MSIQVVRGSLTDCEVDVIVNAANTLMRGGGGIDGRIHALAGPKMLEELRRVAPRGAEVGEPVVTAGYDLKQPWVVHVAGPIWRDIGDEPELLERSYRAAFRAADGLGARSIGFCSISTGAFGFPLELGAEIAVRVIRSEVETATSIERVVFAIFGSAEFEDFSATLE